MIMSTGHFLSRADKRVQLINYRTPHKLIMLYYKVTVSDLNELQLRLFMFDGVSNEYKNRRTEDSLPYRYKN
ncbi:hypothetical protein Lalb_Chr07g0179401 [Lupinus albus]|uniref:Uncharacterized protein n=1 Tax=Lupinus albus TaxID=3870 RepID=A0A6A4Q8T4_LUPAL|nr:hypothetical protein Lalb_Chr07g0179401 [Lupinus albus]